MSSQLSLNSNIAALSAQRQIGRASAEVSRSFERLASGLRINRASDDAAGLAIAERLRADGRLLSTAGRNLNDAISLINIANGTLTEQASITQRLGELAEQASNGTLSSAQRTALNLEFTQLVQESGRLGDSATFNGLAALLGGRGSNQSQFTIQAGISGASTSNLSIDAPDTGTRSGIVDLTRAADTTVEANASDLFTYYAGTLGSGLTFDQLASTFQNQLLRTSITASNGSTHTVYIGVVGNTTNNQPFFAAYEEVTSGGVTQYNRYAYGNFAGDVSSTSGKLVYGPSVDFTIDAGGTFNFNFQGLRFFDSNASPSNQATSLEFVGLESKSRALQALTVANQRLAQLSAYRGQFGAFESRLNAAINVVQNSRDASAAAESRIRDVDVAIESGNLVRTQIIQQAATAVLKQANILPSLALRLLG